MFFHYHMIYLQCVFHTHSFLERQRNGMFLLIGVSPKIKQTGSFSCNCPACGQASSFYACKQYSSLNLFFIPVLPFGAEYIATCGNCTSVVGFHKEKGRAHERDPYLPFQTQDLEILRNNAGPVCPGCSARVDRSQNFCPNCGRQL